MPIKPYVSVFYSRKDKREKDALLAHLGVLKSARLIYLWSEDEIRAGADKEQTINQAIDRAKIAVLLISVNFLTSEDMLDKVVPKLLDRHRSGELTVFPVIATASAWKELPWLSKMEVRPKHGDPVWRENGRYVDEDLTAIVEEVATIFEEEKLNLRPRINMAPHPPYYFVGRKKELNAILDNISNFPICLIHGMGGIGKSTLASVIAYSEFVGEKCSDGVLWTRLGQHPDILAVLNSWFEPLGMKIPEEDDLSRRIEKLKRALAWARWLIVIDDVWSVKDVKPLLVGGIHCRTVITTRKRDRAFIMIDVAPAQIVQLRELAEEEALDLISDLIGHQLSKDKSDLIKRVCKLLQYHPLAIKLAVPHIYHLGLEGFFRRLQKHRIEFISIDDDKELSLRRCFDLTFQQLPGNLASYALLLGLFVEHSEFSLDALATLWDTSRDEAEDISAHLGSWALLDRVDAGPLIPRYRQHALIGEYYREIINRKGFDTLEPKYRLAKYYLSECKVHFIHESEMPNVKEGIRFLRSQRNKEAIKMLIEYNVALSKYYKQQGMWNEKLELGQNTWRLINEENYLSAYGRGIVAAQIAEAYRRQLRDFQLASEWFEKAINYLQVCKDEFPGELGSTLRRRADLNRIWLGKFTQSIKDYQYILYAELLIDDSERGKLLSSLGEAYYRIGELSAAKEILLESLNIHTACNDEYEINQSRRILADVMLAKADELLLDGEQDQAEAYCVEAEKYCHRARRYFSKNKHSLEAWSLRTLGNFYKLKEGFNEAEKNYRQSMEIFNKHNIPVGKAALLKHLGSLCFERGDLKEAKEIAREALDYAQQSNSLFQEATILRLLTQIALKEQNLSEAREFFDQFETLVKEQQNPLLQRDVIKLHGFFP